VGRRAVRWSWKILSASCAALALFAGALPAGANSVSGAWSPVKPWPLIAVHAVLMPDGRVLTYGSTTSGQSGTVVAQLYRKQPNQTSSVVVPLSQLNAN
jgi:hypothetical protein